MDGLRCAYQYQPPAIAAPSPATERSATAKTVSNFFGVAGFAAGSIGACLAPDLSAVTTGPGRRDAETAFGPSVASDPIAEGMSGEDCIALVTALMRTAARSCASSSPVW